MKRRIAAFLICSVILLSGCTKAKNEKSEQEFTTGITYSNLVDKASQEEVKAALGKAGIAPDRIETFLSNVDLFNETVENKTLNEGFMKIDNLLPEYDVESMQDMWDSKHPEFLGYNCRITSYDLMGEFVEVKNPTFDDVSQLFADKLTIDTHPTLFTDDEEKQFMSLYSHIKTVASTDIQTHLDKVKENWKQKGVTFKNEDKASLIFVFFNFDDGTNDPTVFVGHIGVLLKMDDGKLLFVEKLAFQEPYQAIKFNNRTELNDYLMNRYDVEWNQPTSSPFIMENGELLEGYRENPNKNKGE
ncbi:MAG: DUF4300 family protein [Peptostreptococcaceae bacterium]|nr:DUF4300 family protein [Peptostreptococcaceae bacterium]